MANELKMPQLSDTMSSGKIVKWYKKEGDSVERGEALAEVETDKANLQIESFYKGTLLKIMAPAGTNAKVGEVIAAIGAAGENVGSSPKPPAVEAAPKVEVKSAPAAEVKAAPVVSQPVVAAPMHLAAAQQSELSHGRLKASPLARKLAEEKHIDLALVTGTGPGGRIVKRDLDSAPASRAPAAGNAAVQMMPAIPAEGRLTPFSKMRDTIARRMQESVRESPHFYVTAAIQMDEALKLREALKPRAEYAGITVNHLVVKAASYALHREPRVNRTVKEGQLFEPGQVNVGIITAVEDGLLIPVIRNCDKLTLREVVREAKAAVERARAGKPNSSDLSGGTFSISNMGMYDIENFTAIINPGQGAVLAVSSAKQEPIVKSGTMVVGTVMRVTISVDHRIIDGAMAGSWLKFFKEALEVPALLMNGDN